VDGGNNEIPGVDRNNEISGVDRGIPGVDRALHPVAETVLDTEDDDEDHEIEANSRYGKRTEEHNLRPRRPRNYGHLHTTLEHVVMTQHGNKRGLQEYGEAGAKALIAEMQQLHDRAVIKPKKFKMLTLDEKKKTLNYLMFLKKKRCGMIKGRGCADGRKQRRYKTKEETSGAPTVAIKALMLSCTIDATEKRTVVT
jgi:hypothetical protein